MEAEEGPILTAVGRTVIGFGSLILLVGVATGPASVHRVTGGFFGNLVVVSGCFRLVYNILSAVIAAPDLTAATLAAGLSRIQLHQLGVIVGVLGNCFGVTFVTAIALPDDLTCTLASGLNDRCLVPGMHMSLVDRAAGTGHVILVHVGLNVQSFLTVAADYSVAGLVSVGDALPGMIAGRLLNRELIAAHVADALAQIVAGMRTVNVLTALALAGVGTVAIGSPGTAFMVANGELVAAGVANAFTIVGAGAGMGNVAATTLSSVLAFAIGLVIAQLVDALDFRSGELVAAGVANTFAVVGAITSVSGLAAFAGSGVLAFAVGLVLAQLVVALGLHSGELVAAGAANTFAVVGAITSVGGLAALAGSGVLAFAVGLVLAQLVVALGLHSGELVAAGAANTFAVVGAITSVGGLAALAGSGVLAFVVGLVLAQLVVTLGLHSGELVLADVAQIVAVLVLAGLGVRLLAALALSGVLAFTVGHIVALHMVTLGLGRNVVGIDCTTHGAEAIRVHSMGAQVATPALTTAQIASFSFTRSCALGADISVGSIIVTTEILLVMDAVCCAHVVTTTIADAILGRLIITGVSPRSDFGQTLITSFYVSTIILGCKMATVSMITSSSTKGSHGYHADQHCQCHQHSKETLIHLVRFTS